jgi:hypothetical protein
MVQGARRLPPLGEARVRSQVSICGTCGRQSSIGTGLSAYFSFTCHYRPTNSPHSFICLSLTLYNLSKWQQKNEDKDTFSSQRICHSRIVQRSSGSGGLISGIAMMVLSCTSSLVGHKRERYKYIRKLQCCCHFAFLKLTKN